MTLRTSPAQDAILAALAEEQGISKQQAVLRLIDHAGHRATREARMRQIAERGRLRDAEVLRRLSQ